MPMPGLDPRLLMQQQIQRPQTTMQTSQAAGAYTPEQLSAIMGAVQPGQANFPDTPYTTTPAPAQSLNPQHAQNLWQMLSRMNMPAMPPSLGAFLSGQMPGRHGNDRNY